LCPLPGCGRQTATTSLVTARRFKNGHTYAKRSKEVKNYGFFFLRAAFLLSRIAARSMSVLCFQLCHVNSSQFHMVEGYKAERSSLFLTSFKTAFLHWHCSSLMPCHVFSSSTPPHRLPPSITLSSRPHAERIAPNWTYISP
jgi:hypothetical protein